MEEQLHQKIDLLNDKKILGAINILIPGDQTVFSIPELWQENIQRGEKDIKAGRFFTLQDFEDKYGKWLAEQ